ncbi:MAG: gliding motility-associated C-terminal domain-containing protein, partial [Bacteroidales bacterium]
ADAGNAKTVCGFSTTLNGNIPLIGTGKWSQVSGPPTLTIVSPTNAKSSVTSTGPGIFDLVWAISNGTDCPESSDTLKLEFGNTISVVASSNSPVCSGDTIKLFSSITGATYSWKGPNNFLSQIQNPVISNIVHSDSGQYIVYVSGISGNCPNTTDTIYVKFNSPPSIISSADSICSGQTVVLTAIGCKGVVNWSDGSKGATLTKILSSNSVFTATCTDNSCETEPGTPVSIAVVPADFESISGNSTVCEKGTIQLNANGTATTYKWTLPDGSTTGNQNFQKDTVSINDSGIYSLLSTSSKGCTDYDSLEIKVNPLPVINISVKDTTCVGSTEEFLAGEGFASYLWQNNSKLSTCPALAEGIYWVLVTDSSGCKSSDTAWLENCYANIFIPNAFSPNGDLKNDHFKPVTGGLVLLDYSMTIFNRWGQIIFQSEDYLTGWDGKMHGVELPVGTYAYLISYRISDTANQTLSGLLKNRGTVLIVR